MLRRRNARPLASRRLEKDGARKSHAIMTLTLPACIRIFSQSQDLGDAEQKRRFACPSTRSGRTAARYFPGICVSVFALVERKNRNTKQDAVCAIASLMISRDAPAHAGGQASRPADCVGQLIEAAPAFLVQAPDPDACSDPEAPL